MSLGAILGISISVGVVALILIAILLWIVLSYNKFVKLRNKIDESYSTMDAYLTKRYELIPNLVATVKGYAKHESETLEKVIKARNSAVNAKTIEDKAKNENVVSGTLKSLFALTESYPNLKADTSFNNLMNELKTNENEVLNARKYYNALVNEFNTLRDKFPTNIIANKFKFEKRALFEVEDTAVRKNVKVEF